MSLCLEDIIYPWREVPHESNEPPPCLPACLSDHASLMCPSLSCCSGGDARQWSPPPAPTAALGSRDYSLCGAAEMMRAAWPHPAPAHQSVCIEPKTEPCQPASRGAQGQSWPAWEAPERTSRGQGPRPEAEVQGTVARHTHMCTHSHTHAHTHRDLLKHKFLSDLPAPSFTAEMGLHHPQGPLCLSGLVLAAPGCVSDLSLSPH